MDSQNKVFLSMPVFTNCTISSFVHCPPGLLPARENEEILIVDNDGVGHKAFVNACPQNVNAIDIKDFMNIFYKINRIDNEVPILLEFADEVNNNSVVPN